jgi:membrane-associated protein
MNYSRFGFFNVIGGIAWVMICTLSGFFFGRVSWIKEHFEAVLIMVVLISVLPMAIELYLEWRRRRQDALAKSTQPGEAA